MFPKIRGTLFRGPHNKDEKKLGCILGSRYFGKLPLGEVEVRNNPKMSKARSP